MLAMRSAIAWCLAWPSVGLVALRGVRGPQRVDTRLGAASGRESSPVQRLGKGDYAAVLIDGDNVRGKTRFRLSKEELRASVKRWLHSAPPVPRAERDNAGGRYSFSKDKVRVLLGWPREKARAWSTRWSVRVGLKRYRLFQETRRISGYYDIDDRRVVF